MTVGWSWIRWFAAAPLGCAVLRREPSSCSLSLGLRPHNHLGHREKECAGLMTHRKSGEPHSKASTAIGQHSAPKAHPTVKWSPVQNGMWKHSMWSHSEPVCTGTCSAVLHSGMLLFSSHLCRGRRSLREARQRVEELKLSARSCIPSRLMGSWLGAWRGFALSQTAISDCSCC